MTINRSALIVRFQDMIGRDESAISSFIQPRCETPAGHGLTTRHTLRVLQMYSRTRRLE